MQFKKGNQMSIKRTPRPTSHYTVLANGVLRDNNLTFRARGILAAILSRPDNWRTTADSLARESKEGRTAILTALKELENVGYMTRTKYQNEKGQWVWESLVYDTPQKPQSGFPTTGNPTSDVPTSENDTLIEVTNKNKRKEVTIYTPMPNEAITNSNLLAELIESKGVKKPVVTETWHKDMERINRLDGYSWDEIESTIRWMHNDKFWYKVVLSPSKLRKQMTAMQLQMKQSNNGGNLSGWAKLIKKYENDVSKEIGF